MERRTGFTFAEPIRCRGFYTNSNLFGIKNLTVNKLLSSYNINLIMRQLFPCVLFLLIINPLFSQWKDINTGKTGRIHDIYIVNSDVAYVTGDSLFLKTTNGGDSWIDLTSNITITNPSFQTIFFIDENIGFAGRINITGGVNLMKTINGGTSWTDISSSEMSQGVANLFFTSPTVGYTTGGVGGGNVFAGTANGGANWSKVATPATDASKALYFMNDSVGFSGTGVIVKTIDGGKTWNPTNMSIDNNNAVIEILFVNKLVGYSLTIKGNNLLKTVDGGNTWVTQTSKPTGAISKHIAFTDADNGYLSALDLTQPWVTANGGISWNPDTTFPTGNIVSMAAINGLVIAGTLDGHLVVKKSAPADIFDAALNAIKIYPNPVSDGVITIDNPAMIRLTIVIYDVLGKAVAFDRDIITAMNITLPAAVYYMHITDNAGNVSVSRLVVED